MILETIHLERIDDLPHQRPPQENPPPVAVESQQDEPRLALRRRKCLPALRGATEIGTGVRNEFEENQAGAFEPELSTVCIVNVAQQNQYMREKMDEDKSL